MRRLTQEQYPTIQKRMGIRIDAMQKDPVLKEILEKICTGNTESCFAYPWAFGFEARFCQSECPFEDVSEYGAAVDELRELEC